MSLTDDVRAACREIAESARHVTIDLDRLSALEPGEPPALDPERHYLEGPPADVADYLLVLDSINFGSGWFPTLRKRPGMSGYFTVASSLADFWRSSGGWSVDELRALRAEDLAVVLGQEPDHELMGLYAEALRDLGRFLGARRALDLVAEANGSAERLASTLAAGMPFFDDVGFWKRAQIVPNDLALAGVAEFARPRPADHLRRQPGAARAARGRRAASTSRDWPGGSTRASCCRRAPRSARSAAARCTPASSCRSGSGCRRA